MEYSIINENCRKIRSGRLLTVVCCDVSAAVFQIKEAADADQAAGMTGEETWTEWKR